MIKELELNGAAVSGLWLTGTPGISYAPSRVTWLVIEGRDGRVPREGGLDYISLKCAFYIAPEADVNAVLTKITNATTLRVKPEGWSYRLQSIDTAVNFSEWLQMPDGGWTGTVSWRAEPYRYKYPAVNDIEIRRAGTIENPCGADALPLIQVKGSGDITLMIGAYTVMLSGVSGAIWLDCESMMAYDNAKNAQNGKVSVGGGYTSQDVRYGRWPRLVPGNNAISWTGSVGEVHIVPRWRDR